MPGETGRVIKQSRLYRMSDQPYRSIVAHYEECLRSHGTGARAVDWKSADDAALRYDVMLELIRDPDRASTLLDFGCGLAGLKAHMQRTRYGSVGYTGLDISLEFAAAARAGNPDTNILCMDVLAEGNVLPSYDYIIMNGIFTRRHDLTVEAMERYLHELLTVVFRSCRVGLAFNVMSKAVDWENETLFHADPAPLLTFVSGHLTHHFVLRNDYGLHETTIYLYRESSTPRAQAVEATE
jgi:SAM-dependent methyltransferase